MREIKFRAWDGIRMSTSGIMFNSSTGHLELPRVQQMHLMQYTGLKDKNGVNIYEGDIVRGCARTIAGFIVGDIQCKGIHWFVRGKNDDMYYLGGVSNIEVIGNIYENPELLEEYNDNHIEQ